MKAIALVLLIGQWGGDGPYTYPNTMRISEDGKAVRFDVSALPAGAKVRNARLVCWTSTDEKGAVLQNGTVQADKDGLVTIPKLTVAKTKRRVTIGSSTHARHESVRPVFAGNPGCRRTDGLRRGHRCKDVSRAAALVSSLGRQPVDRDRPPTYRSPARGD